MKTLKEILKEDYSNTLKDVNLIKEIVYSGIVEASYSIPILISLPYTLMKINRDYQKREVARFKNHLEV